MSDAQLTIEDLLLQQGVLRPDQVSVVKMESINSGKPTDKIILDHNFATPESIAQARSLLLGIPYIKLQGRAVSAEALNLIPESVGCRYRLMPFDRDLDRVSVALAH